MRLLDECRKLEHDVETHFISDRFSLKWAEISFCWDCGKSECKITDSTNEEVIEIET